MAVDAVPKANAEPSQALVKKHPLAIRWFHWLNFPLLAIMIWSGMLIYWANDVYRVGAGSHTLVHFFPQWFYEPKIAGHQLWTLDARLAEGRAWHFFFMWFFAINGALYVGYTALSGEWRELLPNRNSLREAIDVVLYDLHLSKKHPPPGKFNGAQRIAYTMIVVMGFFSLVSGVGIYESVQFAWVTTLMGGYTVARFLHFWLTIGYVVFFVVHIVQVALAGWNNFRSMITGYEVTRVKGHSS